MKISKIIILTILTAFLFTSCSKDQEIVDTEYPVVDISSVEAFPKQCSILKRGEKFRFWVRLSDNVELGSLGIDIHHNFDHHTHSTEVDDCKPDQEKKPINPFLLIQKISIPAGEKTYQVNTELSIPGDVDPGDYHFMIRLTDKEGWQTIKGLSVKII